MAAVMFKKGDKVKCVDVGMHSDKLTFGKVYEVADACKDFVDLVATDDPKRDGRGFYTSRFKLVEPTVEAPVTIDIDQFKPGMKVVCVAGYAYQITTGKVYEVVRTDGKEWVTIATNDLGQTNAAYAFHRFKPVPAPVIDDAAIQKAALHKLSALVLDELCKTTHTNNVKAGWWDQKDNPLVVPTKLALIASEVSEALEGHRRGLKDDKLTQYDMIAVELADVLIRVFDLAGFLNIPIGTIIAEKEAFNASRADHKPENRNAKNGKKY